MSNGFRYLLLVLINENGWRRLGIRCLAKAFVVVLRELLLKVQLFF